MVIKQIFSISLKTIEEDIKKYIHIHIINVKKINIFFHTRHNNITKQISGCYSDSYETFYVYKAYFDLKF